MKNNFRSIKDSLKSWKKNYAHSDRINEIEIQQIWKEELGEIVNRYTSSIKIQNDTLYIKTTSAPLKSDLYYRTEEILKLVNQRIEPRVLKNIVVQ